MKKATVMPNRKPIIAPGKAVADSATTTASRMSRMTNAGCDAAGKLRQLTTE